MIQNARVSWIFKLNIFRPNAGRREKIDLNFYFHFYFHTSLWYLERFYEGLKGLKRPKAFIKPFEAPQKKCENKNLG